MSKDKMRGVACLMLVDLAASGKDVQGLSKELVTAYAWGSEDAFRTVCKRIGEAYKG